MTGSEKKKRILRIVVLHVVALAVLLLIWRCPFYLLFGVPCPGCGITRAYRALLSGNVAEAFALNPMFLPAGLAFWYVIHRRFLPKHPGPRVEIAVGIVILILMLGVYVYRMISQTGPIVADIESGIIFRIWEAVFGG